MSLRDRLTLAAVVAVSLAAGGLLPIYDGYGWVTRVVGAAVVVGAVAATARALRVPRLLQPLLAAGGLLGYVIVVFAGTTLAYGLVPTGETLTVLRATLEAGLLDVEELGPPVPTTPGLVLLAVLGVGAVAVVVDALAVVVRRPALAGLPLLLMFAVPAAVLPGGLGTLPFVLGATGWLGLLLADGSDIVARWGTPLTGRRAGVGADPGLGRVGRRIGVTALGVAVLVPALIPGLDNSLLSGGNGPGFGSGSRTTTTYNPILELAGQLSLPEPRELLRYSTNDDTPDYLRLTTLDQFDENGRWSSSELSGDLRRDAVQDGIPQPTGTTRSARRNLSTQIAVTGAFDGPWLPVPFPPDEVAIDGPWLWDTEAETVFSTRTSLIEVDEPYDVSAVRLQPSVDLLRASQSVPDDIEEVYAAPPELSPFVRQLLDQTVAGQESDYDRVAALQELFRNPSNGFVYDEQASTPGLNAPDALENFLVGKVGYCEQYSSAMAAMVRGLGIPARVAVGFTQGTPQADGTWVVTTNDAHAWPEVWFDGAGWIRFEPTPRREQVTTPDYSTAPVPVEPDAGPAEAPSAAPAVPNAGPQGPDGLDRGDDLAAPVTPGADGRLSPLLLLLPLALLLAATPALVGVLQRRRRWARPVALTAWGAVHDDAVDVGHAWRAADSPRTAVAHLLAARPLPSDAAAALDRIGAVSERARYARPGDELGPEAAASLHADAETARAGLLATASGRVRWRARLLPPSTLAWARERSGALTAGAVGRADAATAAVTTRLRASARRPLRRPRTG